MTLVVEDGTGLSTAESYVSVADCESYLLDHGADPLWFGVKATAVLALPVQPTGGESFTIGGKTYTLEAAGPTATDGRILIGATVAETRQNVLDAINLTGTPGTQYASNMTVHPDVAAVEIDGYRILLEAKHYGTDGNSLVTTETLGSARNGFASGTLAGGVDPPLTTARKERALREATEYLDRRYTWKGVVYLASQALQWPRAYVWIEDYSTELSLALEEIPQELKDAVCELAIAHVTNAGALTKDRRPTDQTAVTMDRTKVGEIETEQRFTSMGALLVQPAWTKADRLVQGLVTSLGGWSQAQRG